MKIVIVGSRNPVKVAAVRAGFERMFPDEFFVVEGVSVLSGVADQPIDDEETMHGAENRAVNVLVARSDADYAVGLEGGVAEWGTELAAFAWAVVRSRTGLMGRGRTGMFFLPPAVAALIREGKELGDADDVVFNRTNSKRKNGAVGILTGDAITRTSYYAEAVSLALIPLKNPELYLTQSVEAVRKNARV